jgi:hypothetical protein
MPMAVQQPRDDGLVASSTFPTSQAMTVGEFWLHTELDETKSRSAALAAAECASPVDARAAHPSGGMCRIERDVIEVDVVGELTPGSIQVADGVQMRASPAAERADFTVHGSLPVQPWSVSFLDCRTVTRRANALSGFSGTNAHQVVHATWAVTGAHVTAETTFSGFRLQLTGLEEWAGSPGLKQTVMTKPPLGSTISWTTPERHAVEFAEFDQTALLACESSARFAAIDVHGGYIETTNRLALSEIDGWTLRDALARFVVPIQTLMGQLTGHRARIRCLEVQVDGTWCQVFGPLVEDADPSGGAGRRTVVPVLLDHGALTLDHMARWCGLTVDLSPAPHVVAAALSGEFTTVETEALTLATTAEGLDRRLHPEERRFEAETVERARAQMQSLGIDDALLAAMLGLLGHIHEPSMPQRVTRLAESVATAAPDCVGRVNRWKRQVTDMRIAGAHGLESQSTGDDGLLGLHALTRSLRWALRIRLLQECGVADADITSALASSAEYSRDRRHWRTQLPIVFQSDCAQ